MTNPSRAVEVTVRRWPHRATRGVIVVAVLAPLLVGARTASADPVGSATAQATALTRTVTMLTARAEQASQRYDAIQARLDAAVSAQVGAADTLAGADAALATQQAELAARAQALFESGGSDSVFAAVLSGTSPADVTGRLTVAAHLLAGQQAGLDADAAQVRAAATHAATQNSIARTVTTLQVQAAAAAQTVQATLAHERSLQRAASATVRRLAAQQAAANTAAGVAAFGQALTAAGGTLDTTSSTTPTDPTAAAAIAAARTRLGDTYVWGGTGPTTFDCSGLTQWSYAHAGVSLPRTAAEQWGSGPHPSLSQLLPGDLLFWAFDTSDPSTIHHVAIYLGGGLMLAAPHTGTDVQVQPVYLTGYIGATRPWASTLDASSLTTAAG